VSLSIPGYAEELREPAAAAGAGHDSEPFDAALGASEAPIAADAPELAEAEDLARGARADRNRYRLEQRRAERLGPMAFEAKVLHAGNAQVAPLIGLPSGAKYAVRTHRVSDPKLGFRTVQQHVRVDRDRRPPKVRKAERRAERARLAQAHVSDGAREAHLAHNQEIAGCDSRPSNQPAPEAEA
jgi:hypothetical protein